MSTSSAFLVIRGTNRIAHVGPNEAYAALLRFTVIYAAPQSSCSHTLRRCNHRIYQSRPSTFTLRSPWIMKSCQGIHRRLGMQLPGHLVSAIQRTFLLRQSHRVEITCASHRQKSKQTWKPAATVRSFSMCWSILLTLYHFS
jgi:hypothetical protein